MRRRSATVLFLLASCLAACGGGGSGEGSKAVVASPDTARPAVHAVGTAVETFVDSSRPTPAHGPFPGSSSRTLRTTVLFPATAADGATPDLAGAPFPLVVFAHGSGGFGTAYLPMLRAWAAAGYVVAAPEFPVGAERDPAATGDSASIEDLPNLPADLTFTISELLRLSATTAGPLRGAVDPARIGAAGHSLGAMTTLALAANTCCYDARVKAAVILSGRESPFGGGTFFTRIRTPLLLVHGDADDSVAYRDGRKAYADAPPPRFLLTLIGGDHSAPFDPFDSPRAQVAARVTVDFLDQYLKGAAGALDRLKADGASAGVSRLESET